MRTAVVRGRDALVCMMSTVLLSIVCLLPLLLPWHACVCTGVAHRYYGTAVGKGRQSVKTEIERLKFDQLTCRQAVVECAKV